MCKDNKKRKNKNLKKRGFTLVELLAVIIILAIILIISIPVVLDSMVAAKKKAFTEFATRTTIEAQKTYLKDSTTENIGTCILYSINSDLGLTNVGEYKGYVLIKNDDEDTEDEKIYVTLNDDEYMIYAAELNSLDKKEIERYNASSEYLSKDNLLTIANCGAYHIKENNTYIPEVTEFKENAKSSTPKAIEELITQPRKLYTGKMEGKGDWVGVYVNGEITECYNKSGDIGKDYKSMYNGNESNYCTGQVYELDNFGLCKEAKSTICCTAEFDLSSPDKTYTWVFNENQAWGTYPHQSCGIYFSMKEPKHPNGTWVHVGAGGGGLKKSGLYEDEVSRILEN